jgi:motility quorum-sensing regulator/GCU-specific mRNA interferase toxin
LEKRKPTHDLERFKLVCGDADRLQMTATANRSAEQLGFYGPDVARLIRTVDRTMFYKSMTSYNNSRQWHDVYHVPADGDLTIYLKFTDDVVTEFVVLSFKER